MSQTSIAVLLAALLIIALAVRALLRTRPKDSPDPIAEAIDRNESELRAKYRNGISAGQETMRLARVYSQIDLGMLKSILDSKGIPNELLFGNMNTLRTGVGIPGFNDAVITVLKSDFQSAKEVVQDYIGTLQKHELNQSARTIVRNIAEVLIGDAMVNTQGRPPELL